MRGIGIVAALGALVAGCSATEPVRWLGLPTFPSNVETVLIELRADIPPSRGGSVLQRFVEAREHLETTGFMLEYPRAPILEARIAGLTPTLEALQLVPGPLPEVPAGAPSRVLPPPLTSFTFSDDLWHAELTVPDELRTLRVPALDWARCTEAGGCFVPVGATNPIELCTLPCPAPSPVESTTAPMLPEPAARPTMTPCPEGWRLTAASSSIGVETCRPPPASTCPIGQYQPQLVASCVDVGAPCPADGWPASVPADRPVSFVRADAAAGGDGSRAAPYRTIAEASARVSGGAIALARGVYAEHVELSDVDVIGACASETVLTSPDVVVTVPRGRTTLTNLSIRSASHAAVIEGATELVLEDVAIESPGTAIRALDGALVTMRRSVVRGAWSTGLWASSGAQVALEHVVFEDAEGAAIWAKDTGTHVTLAAVSIRGTRRSVDGPGGGLVVTDRATVDASALVVERSDVTNIIVADATFVGHDLFVAGGEAMESVAGGLGVTGDSSVELTRACLARNRADGVFANGGRLSIEDLVVDELLPTAQSEAGGIGIDLIAGAVATIDRAWISQPGAAGVHVANPGSRAEIRGLAVVDARGEGDRQGGYGLAVDQDAHLELHGALLARTLTRAIVLADRATATISDVTIEDVSPQPADLLAGEGIVVARASSLEGARVSITNTFVHGVAVYEAAATISDLTVRTVALDASDADNPGGGGVFAQASTLGLTRAAISDVIRQGIIVDSNGTSEVDLVDVSVDGGARGVVIAGPDTRATIRRLRVRGTGLYGLELAENTSLTASDVIVEASERDGIDISSRAQSDLERFWSRDHGGTALVIGDQPFGAATGEQLFRDGRLTGSFIGASVPRDQEVLRNVATRVVYTDDTETIEAR